MPTYDVTVTRDGRWWMIEVPTLDLLTQARRLSEVEEMATSLIALTLDVPASTVVIDNCLIRVGAKDYAEVGAEIRQLKADAEAATEKAAELSRKTAAELVAEDVPLRDVGALLGVSHQRVAQLVEA